MPHLLGDIPTPEHMHPLQDPLAIPGIPHPSVLQDIEGLQGLHLCHRLGNNRITTSQLQVDRCSLLTFSTRNATGKRRLSVYAFTLFPYI